MIRASAVPLPAGSWRFQFPAAMSFAASERRRSGRVRRRLTISVPPSITREHGDSDAHEFCCSSPSACWVGAHARSSTSRGIVGAGLRRRMDRGRSTYDVVADRDQLVIRVAEHAAAIRDKAVRVLRCGAGRLLPHKRFEAQTRLTSQCVSSASSAATVSSSL